MGEFESKEMKLKHRVNTCYSVDYNDFENFVNELFPNLKEEYSFAEVQECGNDTSHEFNVDGKIDSWDEIEEIEIRNGEKIKTYRNRLLFNVLCKDGHILPGKYIVNVSW